MVAFHDHVWPWTQHACYGLMLVVAAAASITDVRRGVIPNRLLLAGLGAAIGLHLAILVASAVSLGPAAREVVPALLAILSNAAFGLVVSVLLYLLELWSAGDAKLAIVLAVAQPAWVSVTGPLPWAPFAVVLCNAFVVAVAFTAVEAVVRGAPRLFRGVRQWRAEGHPPWDTAELWSSARTALAVVALATAIGPLRRWVAARVGAAFSGGTFIAFLALFLLYKPLARLAARRGGALAFAAIFAGAVAWACATSGVAAALGVASSVLMGLAVVVGRGGLGASSRAFDTRPVEASDLSAGMVLSDEFLDTLEADPRWREAFAPVLGSLRGMKLDANYVANLREWQAHNAPSLRFAVKTPLPFAPALVVGVALTVAFGRLVFLAGRPLGL
jgi:Flp pilus assembly protein protease CpaA